MCGIFGMFSETVGKDPGAAEQTARKAAGLMTRRGPDEEGFWSDQKYCALSFRRLSILDLTSAAHQPMTDAEDRYALVYNGEVYNFSEIREELKREGITVRSSGDTEVVFRALIRWGKEALERFNGMFALAFYDREKKRILLGRDHAGIKPLYYFLNKDTLVFGSQYDQILAHPSVEKNAVDPEALSLYLHLGYIPAPNAILKNTFMLEAGSWLERDAGGSVKHGRFFEFSTQEPDLHGEKAYEAVDEAVARAVKRQLVSDAPLGAFLSGGVDSPLVAAKAKIYKPDLKTFTIGVRGEAMDESSEAMRYAKELNVQHFLRYVDSKDALALLDDVVSACGEPFGDFSIFPTLMVAQHARENGLKVMLSGDGGDELFFGYPKRFGSILEQVREFKKPRVLRAAAWGMNKLTHASPDYPSPRYGSVGEWARSKHTRFSNVSNIFPDVHGWPASFKGFKYGGSDPDAAAQWLRANEFKYHLSMVLLKVDRASMYRSLEVRVPLLDKEVVAVSKRVDWKSCLDLKTRTGKQPLRQSLKKHVSQIAQNKKGFTVPMHDWLKKDLRPALEDLVLNRKEICGLPVQASALRKIYEDLKPQSSQAWWLWMVLSLALWEKKYS